MGRTRSSQSEHDRVVRDLAKTLEEEGFHVEADVRGYRRPNTIGGFRPDVVARDGWTRRIIEVETPDSVNSARDLEQQRAFRQAARRSKHTTFRRIVTEEY